MGLGMFQVTREGRAVKSEGVVGAKNDRRHRRVSELAGKEAVLLGVRGSDGWRISPAVNGETGVAARCRGGSVIGGEAEALSRCRRCTWPGYLPW